MSKKEKKKPDNRKREYDFRMLRDFAQHLLWELRVVSFEHQHPNAVNSELVDQLQTVSRRYNSKGLLAQNAFDTKGLAEAEAESLARDFREGYHEVLTQQMESVEIVLNLIAQAQTCHETFIVHGRKVLAFWKRDDEGAWQPDHLEAVPYSE